MRVKLLKRLRRKADKDLCREVHDESFDYANQLYIKYSYPAINKSVVLFFSSLCPDESLIDIRKEVREMQIEYILYLVKQIRNRP